MIKDENKEFESLRFRINLFKKGKFNKEAGNLIFCGNGNKQIDNEMFNYLDEIPSKIRNLIKDNDYRKKWNEEIKLWEYEKKHV